jgi:hypothetical protein
MLSRLERFPLAVASMVVTALVLLSSASAYAYVRNLTSKGVPIAWFAPCVSMQLYAGSHPPVLTSPQLFAAGLKAADAWSYPAIPGTDLRLSVIAESEAAADVGYDHRNTIVFRQDTWCRHSQTTQNSAASSDTSLPSDGVCYSPNALAVTSIFKNTTTGEIVDADIEFNAVYFAWGDHFADPGLVSTAPIVDFQNTLTHELGHVVGLDHACFSASDNHDRLTDNTGAPELDCYGSLPLPSSITEATMYPSVEISDTSRRTLSPDDELGVSDIYPHLQAACPVLIAGGGCTLGQAPPAAAQPTWRYKSLVALGLVLVALASGRWHRRRDDRQGSSSG